MDEFKWPLTEPAEIVAYLRRKRRWCDMPGCKECDTYENAAKLIESSLSKLDRYRWIPVGERLPARHEDVLCLFIVGGTETHVLAIGDDDKWYRQMDEKPWAEPNFWMPILEAPK